MYKASIILDTRRKAKKGYPVKIRIRNKYINLGIYQNNKKLKRTPEILERETRLVNEINYCNKNNLTFEDALKVLKFGLKDDVKIYLLEKQLATLKDKTNIGILEFYDIVIDEKQKKGESVSFHQQTKKQIKNFIINDEPINNINYEWLNRFILYKKNAKAGVMSYLRNLRAVYKEAQKRNSYYIKKDNPFLGVIKTVKIKEVEELKIDDIQKLFNFKPKKTTTKRSAKIMQRNIDLWLFQFLIGGHDLIDVANLDNVDKRVKFRRYKNRNKPNGGELVDNILLPLAKMLYIKHDGFKFLPKPTVNYTKYVSFRRNYNKSLRTISQNLETTSFLRSKTPRYIFRTLAGEMMIDALVIMQIQGHKARGVTFSYQRKLPNKIIDKQLQRVVKKVIT